MGKSTINDWLVVKSSCQTQSWWPSPLSSQSCWFLVHWELQIQMGWPEWCMSLVRSDWPLAASVLGVSSTCWLARFVGPGCSALVGLHPFGTFTAWVGASPPYLGWLDLHFAQSAFGASFAHVWTFSGHVESCLHRRVLPPLCRTTVSLGLLVCCACPCMWSALDSWLFDRLWSLVPPGFVSDSLPLRTLCCGVCFALGRGISCTSCYLVRLPQCHSEMLQSFLGSSSHQCQQTSFWFVAVDCKFSCSFGYRAYSVFAKYLPTRIQLTPAPWKRLGRVFTMALQTKQLGWPTRPGHRVSGSSGKTMWRPHTELICCFNRFMRCTWKLDDGRWSVCRLPQCLQPCPRRQECLSKAFTLDFGMARYRLRLRDCLATVMRTEPPNGYRRALWQPTMILWCGCHLFMLYIDFHLTWGNPGPLSVQQQWVDVEQRPYLEAERFAFRQRIRSFRRFLKNFWQEAGLHIALEQTKPHSQVVQAFLLPAGFAPLGHEGVADSGHLADATACWALR